MALNELGTEVMGLGLRFWGQEVMDGLGLGWKGTKVILKDLWDQSSGVRGEILGSGSDGWVEGLGWKGTKVVLKGLGRNLWGFRWGFGVWGF